MTIDDVHLAHLLAFPVQLGSKLRLKVEALAEYPDELSCEKCQKDAREILALLKPDGAEPAVSAEVLDRASTTDV